NSDYYMYRWLKANNISPKEVSIIPLDATALTQSFIQDNIDVMFAWEPHNYNATEKAEGNVESWKTELYSGRHTINMNTDYASAHPEVVQKLIKGLIRAEEYIKSNTDDAKQIVVDTTGMSREALDNLWGEYTY